MATGNGGERLLAWLLYIPGLWQVGGSTGTHLQQSAMKQV
jgi:hypothetical protein